MIVKHSLCSGLQAQLLGREALIGKRPRKVAIDYPSVLNTGSRLPIDGNRLEIVRLDPLFFAHTVSRPIESFIDDKIYVLPEAFSEVTEEKITRHRCSIRELRDSHDEIICHHLGLDGRCGTRSMDKKAPEDPACPGLEFYLVALIKKASVAAVPALPAQCRSNPLLRCVWLQGEVGERVLPVGEKLRGEVVPLLFRHLVDLPSQDLIQMPVKENINRVAVDLGEHGEATVLLRSEEHTLNSS